MMTAGFDVAEALGGLLRAEQAGIVHFMTRAEAWCRPGAMSARLLLQRIVAAELRREGELAEQILEHGGTLVPPPVCPEHQYMAFLAMEHLLPKLVSARRGTIGRYEGALRAVAEADPRAQALLERHLTELRGELEALTVEADRTTP